MDARTELIDVGQPGAAPGGGRQSRRLDRAGMERVTRCHRQRHSDQLVRCVAHSDEASHAAGRLSSIPDLRLALAPSHSSARAAHRRRQVLSPRVARGRAQATADDPGQARNRFDPPQGELSDQLDTEAG
jgi:hypothetical protein